MHHKTVLGCIKQWDHGRIPFRSRWLYCALGSFFLDYLELRECNLSNGEFKKLLVKGLGMTTLLTQLDLSQNLMGVRRATALASTLATNHKALKSLKLNCSNIGPQAAVACIFVIFCSPMRNPAVLCPSDSHFLLLVLCFCHFDTQINERIESSMITSIILIFVQKR
mmetsp:Transcript_10469/g.24251  ORF Transcript_10469/g.24251 Transcript_10469/m.24251 type:complete len:167 (-) Transcript_10469:1035-1535(-)